ncbi:MAG TPA: cupredoxin family protein [Hyphomicrobiales bacterium]
MRINPSILAMAMAVVLAASAQAHDAGHGHDGVLAFGEPGDPAKPAREIALIMKEADGKMLFAPNEISVKKGEQIRFRVKNEGEIDHEFVLATLESNLKHAREMEKNPDMEHDEPNSKRLAPGKSAEVLWKFSKAGTFDFSCLIPGHRQAGMTGTVIVK